MAKIRALAAYWLYSIALAMWVVTALVAGAIIGCIVLLADWIGNGQ